MSVLVTGANGFLGSHIVRHLLRQGRDVAAFVLRETDRRKLDELGVEVFEGDLLDRGSLLPALKGREHIFHTAALTDEWLPDPSLIFGVNVEGTRNVCEMALRCGVRRLVYTSSVAACGSAPPGGLADENTPWDLHETGPYSRSKYKAEKFVRRIPDSLMETVVLCPHQIIGPGDSKPSAPGRMIVAFLNSRPLFSIDVECQFVGVDDVARAHIAASERGRPGERYVLAGKDIVPFRSFLCALSEIAGFPAPPIRLPRVVPFMAAYLLHFMANTFTRKPPLLTVGNAHMLYKRMVFSTEKAERELGFRPRDYRMALREAVDWFRRHGYVKCTG
jgi:dihydroflavonol-4-reductase